MEYTLSRKIENCKQQIKLNNLQLKKLSKENERLFRSLMAMMSEIGLEKTERYNRELSTDNWKNTEYYKRNMKRYDSKN